jgi:hypothetical protein
MSFLKKLIQRISKSPTVVEPVAEEAAQRKLFGKENLSGMKDWVRDFYISACVTVQLLGLYLLVE